MKKRVILIVLFGLIFRLLHAQPADVIWQGRILDMETRKPIAYANLTFKNTSVGTISNAQGEFEIHIPEGFVRDSLMISMMGYATYKAAVHQAQSHAIILLQQKSILLSEVAIHDKRVGADEMLNRALKSIPVNYPTRPHVMNGFFRQVQEVDNKYVSVLEAAVDILDPGYGSKKSVETNIIEIRRSNYVQTKSYYNIADTFYTQKYNSLKGTLGLNHVHAIASFRTPQSSFFTGKYTYMLDSAFVYGDRTVYVISAVQKNNKGYLKDPLKEERINTIMVDAETFGILRVQFDYHPRGKYTPGDFVNVTRTNDSILSVVTAHSHIYEFNNYQGLLYLKYMRWSDWVEDYNIMNRKVSHVNEYRHELLINHVIPGAVQFEKVPEPIRAGVSLYKQSRAYHAAFWKNYNVIYESQQERTLVEDLMRQISEEKVKSSD